MQISFATISNHTSVSRLLLPAKHTLTFLCSRKHPFQRSHEDLLKSHYPPHSAGRLLSQHQTSHLPQWLRRLPATHHLSHWYQNHPEQSLCLSIEFHASIPPSRNQHIPPLGTWKNHRIKVLTGSGYLSSQQANGKSWRPLANFETNIQQFEKQKYLTLPSKLDFNKYSPYLRPEEIHEKCRDKRGFSEIQLVQKQHPSQVLENITRKKMLSFDCFFPEGTEVCKELGIQI